MTLSAATYIVVICFLTTVFTVVALVLWYLHKFKRGTVRAWLQAITPAWMKLPTQVRDRVWLRVPPWMRCPSWLRTPAWYDQDSELEWIPQENLRPRRHSPSQSLPPVARRTRADTTWANVFRRKPRSMPTNCRASSFRTPLGQDELLGGTSHASVHSRPSNLSTDTIPFGPATEVHELIPVPPIPAHFTPRTVSMTEDQVRRLSTFKVGNLCFQAPPAALLAKRSQHSVGSRHGQQAWRFRGGSAHNTQSYRQITPVSASDGIIL